MRLQLHQRTTLAELYQLGELEQAWSLDDKAMARVESAWQHLRHHLDLGQQSIYGLHTHFGHNISHAVAKDDWVSHQEALLHYLKVGFGQALEPRIVRRALRLQCYKIGLGFSGVHPETFQRLLQHADSENLPEVPSMGSLGASGDLIPMAHALQGFFQQHRPAGPRDGLALVNTNAMMASLAIDCWHRVQNLLHAANCGSHLHAEGLGWQQPSFSRAAFAARSTVSSVREQWITQMEAWQQQLGRKRAGQSQSPPALQERYSIRCAPQLLMDVQENLAFIEKKINEEALGLADNPIVLESGICHGGLFYTAGLATAAELMQNALVRLCDLMDRQILLTVTPELNHGLPANLASSEPGDHVKGLHQLASALLQKIKGMSLPAYLLSFSCESNNQDIVPASMSSLLLVQESLGLAEELARLYLFIGERAFCLRQGQAVPESLQVGTQGAYQATALLEEYLRCINL